MSLEKKIVASHYTDFGELQFCESSNPHFVFFNAKAVKKEIVVYFSTLKTLANALQTAQSVSKKYDAALAASVCDPVAAVDDAGLVNKFKEEAGCLDKDAIFWKELTDSYGGDVQMKMVLLVNVYKGRPHIWLKPLWQDLDKSWRPTLRGFQFSLKDDARDMMLFANRHMALRERGGAKKDVPLPPFPAAVAAEPIV